MIDRSQWAKLPLRWVHKGGLTKFTDRAIRKVPVDMPFMPAGFMVDSEVDVEALRNECIAALRLYLVLCCRADFKTGVVSATYPQLTRFAKMSRALIARSFTRLEMEGLVVRQPQAKKSGTVVQIEGWNDEYAWGKIPKLWLHDGGSDRMRLLADFNYCKASLDALKVFIAILSFRDRARAGIARVSYTTLSEITGVPRYRVADAITKLYGMNLISFRQGDYRDLDPMDRTNRYLVRGLGSYWPDEEAAADALALTTPTAPGRPSKAALNAAVGFLKADR
ncbi:MarR family transcriptional regulator [Pseudomonas tohonis]|uniref:MarR family transcriptional regulator n=1 Tax=Pseudomonas tohonis TaxID=2725477 RepID=UPI001F1F3112|nr:MarR family transcriptional regulator [Pseudomonas tohonis]